MAASGWYPDPEHREDIERYWDGEQWTDTRAMSGAMPQGWYPDPEHRPQTERYWDGKEWWNTRPASHSMPRPPVPDRLGRRLLKFWLISVAVTLFLILATLVESHDWTSSEPIWTEQECVQAVLTELQMVRAEIEFPTMTEWVLDRDQNPLLDADEASLTRCGPEGRTPAGFDWSGVRDDLASLRSHLLWSRDRPSIEDVTLLEEIEAWVE